MPPGINYAFEPGTAPGYFCESYCVCQGVQSSSSIFLRNIYTHQTWPSIQPYWICIEMYQPCPKPYFFRWINWISIQAMVFLILPSSELVPEGTHMSCLSSQLLAIVRSPQTVWKLKFNLYPLRQGVHLLVSIICRMKYYFEIGYIFLYMCTRKDICFRWGHGKIRNNEIPRPP